MVAKRPPELLVVGLVAGLLAGGAIRAEAQDLAPLVAMCAGGSSTLTAPCQSAILAVQSIRGGIAIADANGSALAGTSSTLGRRLGRTPRVSLAARFKAAVFDIPDVLGSGAALPGQTSVAAYSVKATAAVGVLDGFSILPSVGGFLSLDFIGSLNLVFLEEGDGFSENEGLISIGGRLGLFRESFTMPGVTVSLVQRYGEDLNWGEPSLTGSSLNTDITTTSLRATIGKDLFAMALLAGAGLDWQKGDLGVRVADPGLVGGEGVLVGQNMTTRRPVYYVGASMTRVIFQMSLEAGWAGGFSALDGFQGEYDPEGITPFVDLAFRLTI